MNQAILLLGSEGLIGKAIHHHLSQEGHAVESFDLVNGHDFSQVEVLSDIVCNSRARVLINAFGIDYPPYKSEQPLNIHQAIDSFEKDFRLNVVTTYTSCRLFIDTRNTGSVINFSSIYGLVSPNPRLYGGWEKPIHYGVSKAAIIQLTRHLAVHHAPRFRLNTIAPGGVENAQSNDFAKAYGSLVPLGRMGVKEELLPAIDFLIDDRNQYMTGSVLVVDGGWTSI